MSDPNETTKPRAMIIAEGLLYFIIGAVTPVLPVLDSDRALDGRGVTVLVLTGLIGGAVALKAFFSQAFSKG